MRLIDADEVMRILERNAKRYPYRQIGRPDTYSPYNEAWTDAINQVDAEVSVLPTITPECKRGRWVEIGDEPYDEWECDVCGFVIDGSGCVDPEEYRDVYHYCPNCGAKMTEAEGCRRGFTCHRGYKCMCFQCGENDCERYQSEPPVLTDSLEDELFEQFEKAMKGEKDEQTD